MHRQSVQTWCMHAKSGLPETNKNIFSKSGLGNLIQQPKEFWPVDDEVQDL